MEPAPSKNLHEVLRHALTTSRNPEECERILKLELSLLSKSHGFKATPADFVQGLVDALEHNKDHLTKDYKEVVVKVGTQVLEEFFSAKSSGSSSEKIKKALFFPSQHSEKEITSALGHAKRTIDVCVFSITNNHLADALFDAHDDGVRVRVISDDECMKQKGSDVQDLCERGIEVTIDSNPAAHMHNKFAIIDGQILINGSFNWTTAAVNANNENVTIIEDEDLVGQYEKYFNQLWKEFEPNKLKKTGGPSERFDHRGKHQRRNHHW